MTLVEFIAPLGTRSRKDKILAILYYKSRYEDRYSLTIEDIRKALKAARMPGRTKINVADVLTKSGHYVDTPGTQDGKRLWQLTSSGEQHVRDLLGLPAAQPELEHGAGSLSAVAAAITSKDAREYIEEAITCLRVGALRASIVFVWSGAIRSIQEDLLAEHRGALTAALRKHDPKVRAVSRIDDFAYVKDAISLLAAQDLGLFDKSERGVLGECLSLRNRCGHPAKYRPGPSRVSSFIEDLVSIVFR